MKKDHDFDTCFHHGKEVDLFCQEKGCERPICRSCLTRDHLQHKVVEIEVQTKELLLRRIDDIEKHIKHKISILLSVKDYEKNKTEVADCIVNTSKDVAGKAVKDNVEKSKEFADDERANIEKDVDYITENLALLKGIRESVEKEAENLGHDLNEKIETVTKLREAVKEKQFGTANWKKTGTAKYKQQIFFPPKGKWWSESKKEVVVDMPEEIENFQVGPLVEMNRITKASGVRCKSKNHFFRYFFQMQTKLQICLCVIGHYTGSQPILTRPP